MDGDRAAQAPDPEWRRAARAAWLAPLEQRWVELLDAHIATNAAVEYRLRPCPAQR